MSKKRIVFASVLKPVDDVRTYYKLAKSLVPTCKYDIFIIGFPSKQPVIDPDIKFLPLPAFSHRSLKRLHMHRLISQQVESLSPDLLVINTHELLSVAAGLKQGNQMKLIYDIRENYFDNLNLAPFAFSVWMARKVRRKEARIAPHIDHFILAEKCYKDMLPFIENRYTVLENKSVFRNTSPPKEKLEKIVFSGTLAEQTGVFRAIQITRELVKNNPAVRLGIVGNSFDRNILRRLHEAASAHTWIELDIDEAPRPYSRIRDVIQTADAGMMLYKDLPALNRKMPTKLYEYVAHKLPVICPADSPWLPFLDQYPAALTWNHSAEGLFQQFEKKRFYVKEPGSEVLWEEEGDVFSELIEAVVSR